MELTVTKRPMCSSSRQHLLVHTARTHGYSKIMLGENCTRLAVKLLTSISLGRGAQLAHDTVCMDAALPKDSFFIFTFKWSWCFMSLCVCTAEQGFSDSRYSDIVLVRPMRDYTAREIAYYNHLFNVPSVFIPSLDTKVSSNRQQVSVKWRGVNCTTTFTSAVLKNDPTNPVSG